MIYDAIFANALTRLRDEQRYRVFIEIERIAGRCPTPFGIRRTARETS